MVTAVAAAAVLEPPPRRPRHRLAGGGEFELRHWRPARRGKGPPSSGMKGRWVPPEIEIPTGGGAEGGYTSLRDIISSPEYAAAAKQQAAAAANSPGAGAADMIRHPLVKHAAYAYLQMTPSAREDPAAARRSRRWRGPLCRLLLGCLSFFGALFRP